MRPLLFAILAFALTAPAAAMADARRDADAIISRADAKGLFANETGEEGPLLLRHLSSGLQCLFEGGPGDALTIGSLQPRGADVICGTDAPGFVVTFYAMRYPDHANARDQEANAVQALRNRFADARNYRPSGAGQPGLTPLVRALPPTVSDWFTATFQGEQVFTAVFVMQSGPWTYMMRATGPLSGGPGAEADVERMWITRMAASLKPETLAPT